jgi:DNA-directed RNA polymerase subunit RPC12/RpoP
MDKAIAMRCPNCGAALEITSDLETFSCAYCGSTIKVTRHGGTVSLKQLEQAINGIKTSTDRIAAELALKRLGDELGEVTSEIITAEFDLEKAPYDLMPVKSFDYSFPLKINGERNWSATPRHEFVALITWATIATVIGILVSFAASVVVLVVAWVGILASRTSRIREIEENNAMVMDRQKIIKSRLADLRDRETLLNRKIRRERSIVEIA